MAFDTNAFINNPWTNIGLGILGANKPGASFGQAVGGGGLLGLQSYQQAQAYQQRMEAARRAQEQEERERADEAKSQQYIERWIQQQPLEKQAQYRAFPQLAVEAIKAQMTPGKPVALSPGSVLVDPVSGKRVTSAPFKPDKPERPRIVTGADGIPRYEDGTPLPGFPQTPDPGPDAKAEADLRKEFSGTVKEFAVIDDAWGRIQAVTSEPTAAGDMALIFSYMKLLDPNSTVREGEYASAQNAGSVSETVRGLYNSLVDGKFLGPKQRQDFIRKAGTLYNVALKKAKTKMKRYEGYARAYGIDPSRVVYDPASYGEYTPPADPQTEIEKLRQELNIPRGGR